MNNFKFTVVLSSDSSKYNVLDTGDIFELCKVDNEFDANAIGVFYKGENVGYVANSKETILSNSMSANQLCRLITDKKVCKTMGILRTEIPFINKAGKQQRRFYAEAFFVPVRNTEQKKGVKLSYEVFGAAAQNPQKSIVLSMIVKANENGEPVNIDINVGKFQMGDKVHYKVFLPNASSNAGATCGEIKNPDTTLEELLKQNEFLSGKVVGQSGKQGYIVEVVPETKTIDEFFAEIDATVCRCVDQAPVIEKKATAMLKAGFSPELINAVLQQMPTLGDEKVNVPQPKQIYHQKNGSNLADMVSYMLLGKMVRLVGEKGAGKNTLVETACWLLNRSMCRVQGSSEMDKMDIQGSAALENGNTSFVLSDILTTLQNDGIVVLDEANSVRPDVLMLFHSLTDDARSINVPGYGAVHMGDHACVVYTLNENYIGTGEMNPATIDRGPSIIVKQETDVRSLLENSVPDAKKEDIELCAKVSENIQKAVNESGMLSPESVTIRGFIDTLECAKFIPIKRGLLQNVAYKAQSEAERQAIEGIIFSLCA